MKETSTIALTQDGGVATVTLDRPTALNAINHAMADELTQALVRLAADASVKVVVLAGSGGAFCAGGDVRGMAGAGPRTAEAGRASLLRYHRMVKALHALPQPVVAAAEGAAFGAGFSLLLLCDIVLLGDGARLCMAFQRLGLVPDCGALFTLPRIVGLQRAKELMLSGREIDAREAQAMGIALEVVAAGQALARAHEIAQAMCGASPLALEMTKRALDASFQCELDAMLDMEAAAQGIALSSDYLAEASRRFVAREPAAFRWPARRTGSE